jgi:hypothetical protein
MDWFTTRFKIGAALTLLVTASILVVAIAPATTLAETDQRYHIERFETVTVPIDLDKDMGAFRGFDHLVPHSDIDPMMLGLLATQLDGLITVETDFDMDSAREVESIDDVEAHFPHTLLTPGYLPSGIDSGKTYYGVSDAGYVSVTVDVARLQFLSMLLGLRIDGLPNPSEHPEATVTLTVPEAAVVAWESRAGMLLVGQMESPVLEVSDGVDVEQMREDILSLPIWPKDVVEQIRAIDDWETTFIVPVPEGVDAWEIEIDGADALVLEIDFGSAILWQSNGIVYVVAGDLPADELIQIAESMS